MPPLAIPFKLRARLSKLKTEAIWLAELTQRASGLPNYYHLPVEVDGSLSRAEAAQKAREAFAKRDIQVVIR